MPSNKNLQTGKVTLREVNSDNVRSVCELSVNEEQQLYVAPNAIAVAEACYSKEDWLQAIYVDETPVGLAVVNINPEKNRFFLWRFMIDARYQGSDFGRCAMNLLIEHVRAKPNSGEFLTSVVPGDHCPQGFYESLGFLLTGEWYQGETMMRLLIR
jgi:diamine N-acetyltransferase